ncbi:MAG TPA: hypothetical protein PKY81_18065 [bacterium]|nr:hypothetical protein [bacterium]
MDRNLVIANIKENMQKIYNAFGIIENCLLQNKLDDIDYAIVLSKKSLDSIVVDLNKLKNEG